MKSNLRGALCLTCHPKQGWLGSRHEASAAPYPATGAQTVGDLGCLACHKPHNGEGPTKLLTTQNRTNIETDQLDDETIGAIDRVIRQRTQDQSGIVRVSKPRQSLEGLFLDIVERARAEQVNTSGATAGGETASFLKGDAADTAQGDALISKLLTVEPVESARESKSEASSNDGAPIESSATAGGAKPDDNVIDSLMEMYGGEAAAPKDAPSSAAPKPSPAPTAANPQPIPAAAKPVAPVQRSNAADVSLIDSLLAKDPPKDGN